MRDDAYDRMVSEVLERVDAHTPDPVRGDRARSDRLVVVDVNKDTYSFAYGQIVWTVLKPKGNLVLRFATHSVTVHGESLDVLHGQVLRKELLELKAHEKDPRGWGYTTEPFIKNVYVTQIDAEKKQGGKPWVDGDSLPPEPEKPT